MNPESVKLVCFSPTGTSKKVGEAIVKGMTPDSTQTIDITRSEKRAELLKTGPNEVMVIAVPVYMGRVPAIIHGWLNRIEADQTPAVCVVVYGNREYENALLELTHMVTARGGIPIAAAAYIGEHSFSSPDRPVAQGRPDNDDLNHAALFGEKIREKLGQASSLSPLPDEDIPGSLPYGGVTQLWDVDFIGVNDQCIQCGTCARVCPADAVDPLDAAAIDKVRCITCCACIKNCPNDARSIKPGPVEEASKRLNASCKTPRQPEYYL